jgi:hypothetical protein
VTAEELRRMCLLSFIRVSLFPVHSLPNSSLTYTLLKPTTQQHVHQYSPFPFQLSPASPSKSWQHPLADHFLCYTPSPTIFVLSPPVLPISTAHSEGWTSSGQQRLPSPVCLHLCSRGCVGIKTNNACFLLCTMYAAGKVPLRGHLYK